MLSIRLSRAGKKKQPFYRLIVAEKTKDPWGDVLENLGTYNPKTKAINFKADRIKYYLSKGAKASPTVYNFLISQNIISGEKVRASKTKPGKKKAALIASKKKSEADEAKKIEAGVAEAQPAAAKSE